MTQSSSFAASFSEQGYALAPGCFSSGTLEAVTALIQKELSALSADDRERFRRHGSMIPLNAFHPIISLLVPERGIIGALHQLGFPHPRWMSGYIISKPPHSSSLWWHQDWWAWDEVVSAGSLPPQLFANIYIQKTTAANGCLRVLPGTHRKRIPLHDALPVAHSHDANDAPDDSVIFERQPGEQDIEVEPGDVVFGDVRLLHATHPNTTDDERTCIVLWFIPDLAAMPVHLRAFISRHHCLPPHGWWHADADVAVPDALRPYLPQDDAPEMPVSFNRVPSTLC